jgi:hypothetical protein
MNDEQQFAEIEKTMFDLDGAIQYASESIAKLRRGGAPAHLIEAMESCRDEIRSAHRRLLQRTYFARPETSQSQDAAEQTTLV